MKAIALRTLAILAAVAVAWAIVARGCVREPVTMAVDAGRDAAPSPEERAEYAERARRFAAGSGAALWFLDVSTPSQTGLLLPIVRYLDRRIGYPFPTYDSRTGQINPAHATLHHTWPDPHPSQPGRWRLTLDARAIVELQAVSNACVVAIDAGTAPAACSAIVALPTPTKTLDSSWASYDGGGPAGAPADALDGGDLPAPATVPQ